MNRQIIIFCVICFLLIAVASQTEAQNFRSRQKANERVKQAYDEKENLLKEKLRELDLKLSDINILLIAYKKEMQLELWVKNRRENKYQLLITYPVCASSGDPGPKIKEGDGQVPEGFYFINDFNNNSNFHL